MNESRVNQIDLPTPVREGLELFVEQLRDALGEQLVSVILYGGLAKGEYAQPSSDVNVMLVLKEVTLERLDQSVSPVQRGLRDFGLTVLVMTESGLRRATDVFPIKFLDMQHYHRVLWGKDVLADLHIARDHLRLRCAQEIQNLLLRLRHFYLHRARRTELVEGTLNTAISSFLSSLSALLTLKTGRAPMEKRAIVEAAAREWNLDAKPLQDALALKSGQYEPDAAELKRLYGAFMSTVQRAADVVDQL